MSAVVRFVLSVGDFVFAKMKGFAPWPGQVEELRGNYARVRFLADNDRW